MLKGQLAKQTVGTNTLKRRHRPNRWKQTAMQRNWQPGPALYSLKPLNQGEINNAAVFRPVIGIYAFAVSFSSIFSVPGVRT